MKIKKTICILLLFLVFIPSKILAHGGNVSGYQDKESTKISHCKNKHYAFHKQNGKYHYHEVKFDTKNNKWSIIDSKKTYDENPCGHSNERKKVEFSSCVDGDTAKVVLDKEIITLRFLAIDTPETVHPKKEEMEYGKEASNFTCESIKNAKDLVIEYDSGSEKQDKYNRHLVWIFTDDKLLQQSLIEKGYAKIDYIYGDYKYTNDLRIAEIEAKNKKIGIWRDFEDKSNKADIYNIIALLLIIIILLILNNKKVKKILKKVRLKNVDILR